MGARFSFLSDSRFPAAWPQLAGLLLAIAVSGADTLWAGPPFLAQGEMAGEATATSVLLQTRLTAVPGPELDEHGDIPGAVGEVRFEISADPQFTRSRLTDWQTATAENDFIVRAEVTFLPSPGAVHFYRVHLRSDDGEITHGPTCQFRTLPQSQLQRPIRFCMGSCMNYHSFMSGISNGGGPVTATAEDRRLGYPAFVALKEYAPDFFIGAGDIVYYDHPRPGAKTVVELRRKWHEQFRFPRLTEFFRNTSTYWLKDDHDFRYDDADLRSGRAPEPEVGIDLFREQLPIVAADNRTTPTYRTHRVGPHLQLWFLEGRDFRSPNNQPDGPDKSIWGADQKKWLLETLANSEATWKIVVSPTPMVGPDSARKTDNHTNLNGFRAEAQEFFDWVTARDLNNVFVFCGDRHWQYHSIHPQGVEEFSCGALNDENSIRGSYPGQKNSTDPEGLIQQPYHYEEPTGGFLAVEVHAADQYTPPRLIIEFRDDHGVVLHRVQKTGDAQ